MQYQAQKTGQIRPGLRVHVLKADDRAVCGNSRREPQDNLGPGTVTCESCARDAGHTLSFKLTKEEAAAAVVRLVLIEDGLE